MTTKPIRHRAQWSRYAACHDTPTFVFYEQNVAKDRAKLPCATCPVLTECYAYAIVHEEYGYLGDSTARERKKARKGLLEVLGWQAVRDGWLEPEHSLLSEEDIEEFRALAAMQQQRDDQIRPRLDRLEIEDFSLEFDLTALEFELPIVPSSQASAA